MSRTNAAILVQIAFNRHCRRLFEQRRFGHFGTVVVLMKTAKRSPSIMPMYFPMLCSRNRGENSRLLEENILLVCLRERANVSEPKNRITCSDLFL